MPSSNDPKVIAIFDKTLDNHNIKLINFKRHYGGLTEHYIFDLHINNEKVLYHDTYTGHSTYYHGGKLKHLISGIEYELVNNYSNIFNRDPDSKHILNLFFEHIAYNKLKELEWRRGIMFENATHRYIRRFNNKMLDNQTFAGKKQVQNSIDEIKADPQYTITNISYLQKLGYNV